MKGIWIAILLLTFPVLAVHTSDVDVSPRIAGSSEVTDFTINITNEGKDGVNEVRVRTPVEFSALECGAAPTGWKLVYSDAVECDYKTVSSYLTTNKSLVFAVDATTAAKDGNYTWEIRSRDVFDGFSLHAPVTVIDGTPPVMANSTLEVPNGGEKWEALSRHNILWHFRDITDANLLGKPITLEYTTDGKNWVVIATGLENSVSYLWSLPNVTTGKASVRITATDAAGNSASDVSDRPFSITAPAPTVSIKAGESKTVEINGRDATITVRSVEDDIVTLLIKPSAAPQATPTPRANATATPAASPAPAPKSDGTTTAVIVVLVAIILYMIWRLQQVEKKKGK